MCWCCILVDHLPQNVYLWIINRVRVGTKFVDFNPNKLYCYPFIVSLDRCSKNCNTAEDPSDTIWVLNKIKTLVICIFGNSMGKFDGGKCNSKQKRNNNKYVYAKEIMLVILACACECLRIVRLVDILKKIQLHKKS